MEYIEKHLNTCTECKQQNKVQTNNIFHFLISWTLGKKILSGLEWVIPRAETVIIQFSHFFLPAADGSSILVRQCGDYDWGSHCGDILYDAGDGREELVDGCLESCNHDGCNSAIQNKWSVTLFLFTFLCIRYVFEFC